MQGAGGVARHPLVRLAHVEQHLAGRELRGHLGHFNAGNGHGDMLPRSFQIGVKSTPAAIPERMTAGAFEVVDQCETAFSAPTPVSARTSISAYFPSFRSFDSTVPR
ncbi:hypothetical protein GCM10009634_07160 [Saccharothrix xinjiangensis]